MNNGEYVVVFHAPDNYVDWPEAKTCSTLEAAHEYGKRVMRYRALHGDYWKGYLVYRKVEEAS